MRVGKSQVANVYEDQHTDSYVPEQPAITIREGTGGELVPETDRPNLKHIEKGTISDDSNDSCIRYESDKYFGSGLGDITEGLEEVIEKST